MTTRALTSSASCRISSGVGSSIRRKIIHTPTSTNPAPSRKEVVNVSPPNNQPNATAPGGVINEIVCRFVTVILGNNQYNRRNVSEEPMMAR